MKRCPQCNRLETDDALKFCRVDGTLLIPLAGDKSESATMALPVSQPSEEISTGPLRTTPSLAVLPFVNLSADAENEYFCDGLAEELLNALAKIDQLKVAARTSAFSFKDKNVNVSEMFLTSRSWRSKLPAGLPRRRFGKQILTATLLITFIC